MKNDRYFKKCITFGRAAEGLRADLQAQLRETQREIGFEYVRFHGIFHDDMAVYHEDENGQPYYWFGYVDKLIDFLLSVHLKPFLELAFMPVELATVPNTTFWWKANGCPPTDYDKWADLVRATVEHLTRRYGEEEVKTWYFEVWNEPNLGSFFRGTRQEYFRLYTVTAAAVKSVCPAYRVGGPSTSGADFREGLGYLREFADFCAENHLPVDFFTAHPYPTYWALDGDGSEKMGYISKDICLKFLDDVRAAVADSSYPEAEIVLTEWNSSPSPRDLVHDTPFMASFLLYNYTHGFGKVDGLAYWALSDIFEENGPGLIPFHGGFGLINGEGIKKPSYWAFWMLNRLGGEILEVGEDHVIARQGQDYQVIAWNYCYYTDEFAAGDRSLLGDTRREEIFCCKEHPVELALDLQGEYAQTVYTLDRDTSAYHNWLKMGAPQYPTVQQAEALRRVSRPKEQHSVVRSFLLHEVLQPHEVRCYLLKKQ